MSLLAVIFVSFLALSAIMAVAWAIAEVSGNHGWVDVMWSFAVGVVGVGAALAPIPEIDETTTRQLFVALLAGLWSARLGGYIMLRTAGASGDDPRYVQLREEWGATAPRRMFVFLQIQALAAFLLVVTILAAARNPAPAFGFGDMLGIVILLIAILGEGLSDRQLAAFRRDPANKGRVCEAGLWAYSRHPNYFFQWLGWVAYVPIALDLAGGYGFGFAALIGPIFMYWLLVHGSGVPILEEHMLKSRGDAYRDYQARVSAFFPLPPAKRKQQSAA